MNFGEIIKQSRENRNLSQQGLSWAIKKNFGFDISAAYISMIENNTRENPSLRQIGILLDFFELPLSATSSLFKRHTEYSVATEITAVHETQAQYLVSTRPEAYFKDCYKLPPEGQQQLKDFYDFLMAKYANNKETP